MFAFLVATIGKIAVDLLLKTCRWQIDGIKNFTETASINKTILLLWHSRLFIAPYLLNKFTNELQFVALVSNSRDGALIAKLVASYNKGSVIKVAHDSRHAALRQLIKELKVGQKVAVITPDGPRGPIEKAKDGVAAALKLVKAKTFALKWSASSSWRLSSWDQMEIPKPFSTIKIEFTEIEVDLTQDVAQISTVLSQKI